MKYLIIFHLFLYLYLHIYILIKLINYKNNNVLYINNELEIYILIYFIYFYLISRLYGFKKNQ